MVRRERFGPWSWSEKVIIIGGGSAGWLTACRLAAQSVRSGSNLAVVLVESATVPSVGVGEGTWPTMRNTLRKIGIDETTFIRSCDASLKQGARFVGWTDGSAGDAYYHPLNPPAGVGEIDLAIGRRDRVDARRGAAGEGAEPGRVDRVAVHIG